VGRGEDLPGVEVRGRKRGRGWEKKREVVDYAVKRMTGALFIELADLLGP
jgi:hypothetical protein